MEKKLIQPDHFKEFVNLAGFEKLGKNLLYTSTRAAGNGYQTDLWLLDTETEAQKQLTDAVSFDLYHGDGDRYVILTALMEDEDKALSEKGVPLTCFYRLDVQDGSIAPLFKVHKNVSDFARIDDDRYVLLCADSLREDALLKAADGDFERFAQLKKEEADYFVAEEVPFWANGSGYCDGDRGRLFFFEKGQLTQISPDDISVAAMKSCEDRYVVYYGMKSGGVQNTTGRLYLCDIEKKEAEALDDSDQYVYTYVDAVSEDEIFVCRNDRTLHGEYQDEFIDLLNLRDGSFIRKNSLGDYHIYDSVICDVSYKSGYINKLTRTADGTYFVATQGEASKVFFWADEEELPRDITGTSGKVVDYEVIGDRIYMIAMRGLGGTELYVQKLLTKGSSSIPEGGKERRITEINTHLQEEFQYAKVESLPYVNGSGIELQGWYLAPVNYEEGKKYPTILFIHGGPQAAYGEVFNLDMQLFASRGYGVIYCNPTGSEGRGGDFGDIRMKYGTVDYEDLIGFTRYAAEKLPWIDENRLGVTGGSYGGIMTNWIIGHCGLFKAAVSDRSSANNISDFGLSDIGVSFALDTYGGTPWDNHEFLWDSSPLKYAPNIKTPTLWIHGMSDYRCTFDTSLQMHTALTYFGVPSRVVGFQGEHHGMSRTGKPSHRIRRLEEMAAWFEKYL